VSFETQFTSAILECVGVYGVLRRFQQYFSYTGKNNHGNSFQWFDNCHVTNSLTQVRITMATPSNGLTPVMTQTILDTGKNNHGNSFQWFDTCHDTMVILTCV
jgi:hypothetical protein